MDVALATVTVISLTMAFAMGIVTWRLIREARRRPSGYPDSRPGPRWDPGPSPRTAGATTRTERRPGRANGRARPDRDSPGPHSGVHDSATSGCSRHTGRQTCAVGRKGSGAPGPGCAIADRAVCPDHRVTSGAPPLPRHGGGGGDGVGGRVLHHAVRTVRSPFRGPRGRPSRTGRATLAGTCQAGRVSRHHRVDPEPIPWDRARATECHGDRVRPGWHGDGDRTDAAAGGGTATGERDSIHHFVPDAGRINRYRISFVQEQTSVPHIDRRRPNDPVRSASPPPTGDQP